VTAAGRPVGVHAPTAGGLARSALAYLDATGAQAVQVFVGNPRGWRLSAGDPEQDAQFAAACARRGVPAYVHATLLVNLGSPTAQTVRHSAATLDHALSRAGVVFHAVCAVDEAFAGTALRQVREALLPLLDRAAAADGPRLLVEPSAGGGRSLAARVEQLGAYLEAVDGHPWLGVCFDTCHAWAAGHDLARPGGMSATLDALVAVCGPDRLRLVHANDSKDPCGSLRDRHENIGRGLIGEAAFAELLAHPATAGVPLIVETPTKAHHGHAADVATLLRLAAAGGRGPRRAGANVRK
jgi:deoxyribonuclease-4